MSRYELRTRAELERRLGENRRAREQAALALAALENEEARLVWELAHLGDASAADAS